MSKVDYSSLINEDEIAVSEASTFGLTRESGWISLSQGVSPTSSYHDEKPLIIDNKKNIAVNDEQINVTQENRGQYISFEMNRTYDGIDFGDGGVTQISIYYVNADGNSAEDIAYDARYNDEKLRFGWLLTDRATAVTGDLNFEIHISGIKDGESYLWKS
jgi:hypothetical protein